MTKTIFLLFCASLMVILVGCSKIIRTDIYYDQQMDFSQYHTFAFFDQSGKPARLPDPFLQTPGARDTISQTIENLLIKRGFRRDRINEADFLIAIHAGPDDYIRDEMKHWRYAYGNDWHLSDDRSFPQGTLILDFVDADVNTIFWRGSAPDVLIDKRAVPNDLESVISSLLGAYPPGAPAPEGQPL
ncbi:MAG: DUF4136 domain-containing protein [bacterium]|nr:DUF4136 domain-containing protein [bacterium]